MGRCWLLVPGAVMALLASVPAYAASPSHASSADAPLALLAGTSTDALAGTLRGFLVRNLPDPLFQDKPGWGHTAGVPLGIKWKGQGLRVHPEVIHGQRNHGTWRMIKVSALNPADTMVLDLREVHKSGPGQVQFEVFISFDCRVDFTQQNWANGMKLYDGSLRARFRIKLGLQCEVTTRVEPNGTFLPDAIFRLRVLKSNLQYDNFVTEHIGGVGGEVARLMGDGVKRNLRPSLEREFLGKANAAIVKAGDTKEVRLSLAGLFK